MAAVTSAKRATFAYTLPLPVYDAPRVLLQASDTTPADVLLGMLRGIRRATPFTRILVLESVAFDREAMMDDNTLVIDTNILPQRHYGGVIAPALLAEVGTCISITALTANETAPPTLVNLQQLTTQANDLAAVYQAIGHVFVGSVVAVGEQVMWGDDVLAVEQAAYRLVQTAPPDVLHQLARSQKA